MALLAAPGVIWLVLLFLVPSTRFSPWPWGARSHLRGALPAWNPLAWDPRVRDDLGEIFTGQLGVVFLRTLVYVAVATFLSLLIGYPVAYYVARARRPLPCCS